MAQPAPLFNDGQQGPFLEAARRGDLPAVQRYFELPDVRENVAIWNAVHRTERLGEPSPVPSSRHLPRPWHFGTHRDQHLFSSAIVKGGQVELFQWFFAREQLERFGETLRTIVGDTLHRLIFADDYTAAREMVEFVFESPVFQEVMDDDERLETLGQMLNTVVSRGYHWWLGALLGHGADPNLKVDYETPLTAIAYQGNSKTLDVLLAHGAWMEGDELLTQRAYNQTEALVGELLRRGADANANVGNNGSALHEAASQGFGKRVWLLINKGFADVDARDARGRTPLMVVDCDHHNYRRDNSSKLQIVSWLLEGGASVHAVDNKGRGVLHHMLWSRSTECLPACLEHGADPNLRDADGRTPMAALLDQNRHNVFECMAEMFRELLRAGADPFLLDNSGMNAAEMLASTDTGRAFLEAEAAFFRR